MRASDRVQAWRQRMRNEGKEPMTIWVGRDEKLRLEDLARTWRCSPSDLVQQALAHFHPTSPHVTATVTDTEQLRALIQAELGASSLVTATITDTVTATLPHLVHGLVQDMLKEHATATVADTDTATVTDTSALAEAATPSAVQHQRGRQPGPLRQQNLTLLTD